MEVYFWKVKVFSQLIIIHFYTSIHLTQKHNFKRKNLIYDDACSLVGRRWRYTSKKKCLFLRMLEWRAKVLWSCYCSYSVRKKIVWNWSLILQILDDGSFSQGQRSLKSMLQFIFNFIIFFFFSFLLWLLFFYRIMDSTSMNSFIWLFFRQIWLKTYYLTQTTWVEKKNKN